MEKLVTRDSLQKMLDSGDVDYVNLVIGRALVGIFNRQTKSEQMCNDTNQDNGVGFTGADAHSGCISAKYFLRHKTFLVWQRARWTKKGKSGYSRVTKYWKQLNEIANEKKGKV